jgi:pimeloyl-ACP methyl ester carboxylesterase
MLIDAARRNAIARFCAAALLALACNAVFAAAGEIGAIVMHGKWGAPDRLVNSLASALEREGYLIASPEMPWSRRRQYDRSVADADSEIDAEIAKLKARGAKQIFVIGHSLGAAHALHYGSRAELTGVIAVAPGHRPEAPRFAQSFANDVSSARALAAAGKGNETVSFTDLNTGNRRDRLTASATSFLSYFDPEGPLNMSKNVAAVNAATPVLWIVPTREESPAREGVLMLYKRLPRNPATQLAEPEADHMQAPAASTKIVIEWMRAVSSRSPP